MAISNNGDNVPINKIILNSAVQNLTYLMQSTSVPYEELIIDFRGSRPYNWQATFKEVLGLKRLVLTDSTVSNEEQKNITSAGNRFFYTFADSNSLEEIVGWINLNSATSNSNTTGMFAGCFRLKEVRFVEETIKIDFGIKQCYSLSNESIQSLINGLKTFEDGETHNITLHKSIKNKLTETQLNTIANKGWTLA